MSKWVEYKIEGCERAPVSKCDGVSLYALWRFDIHGNAERCVLSDYPKVGWRKRCEEDVEYSKPDMLRFTFDSPTELLDWLTLTDIEIRGRCLKIPRVIQVLM